MLDDFTFGKHKAAINLARILNEIGNGRITAKVQTFFSYHNYTLKHVCEIKDLFVRKTILNMLLKNVQEHIIKAPEIVRTHILNVYMARVRDELRKLEHVTRKTWFMKKEKCVCKEIAQFPVDLRTQCSVHYVSDPIEELINFFKKLFRRLHGKS